MTQLRADWVGTSKPIATFLYYGNWTIARPGRSMQRMGRRGMKRKKEEREEEKKEE